MRFVQPVLQVPMDIQALQQPTLALSMANSITPRMSEPADDDLDESEDDAAASMSYDPDPFAAAIESVSSGDDSKKEERSQLRTLQP